MKFLTTKWFFQSISLKFQRWNKKIERFERKFINFKRKYFVFAIYEINIVKRFVNWKKKQSIFEHNYINNKTMNYWLILIKKKHTQRQQSNRFQQLNRFRFDVLHFNFRFFNKFVDFAFFFVKFVFSSNFIDSTLLSFHSISSMILTKKQRFKYFDVDDFENDKNK